MSQSTFWVATNGPNWTHRTISKKLMLDGHVLTTLQAAVRAAALPSAPSREALLDASAAPSLPMDVDAAQSCERTGAPEPAAALPCTASVPPTHSQVSSCNGRTWLKAMQFFIKPSPSG